MAAVLRQQLLLDVIELLAQVHIVAVGVVEALDLVPERVDLRGAVGADLLERGLLVNQLAVFEDRHEQLARLEVIDLLALPGRLGVKDGHFVAVVHRFVVNAQVVRDGLARVAAIEAVELLEVRRGDLADVLADLDLGDYIAVLILYGDELVDAAEHRLAARGDEPLAHAEQVDLRALRSTLQTVTAPDDGYITEVNVKAGETFDASGPAYSFSPEKEDPVLRIDTSKTTLTISRGTDVTFDSARGGTAEGSVDSTGVTVSGDTYADVELSSRMIRDLGGSIAMLAEDIPVRVSYRSNDNTTLLPSSAVRGAGDDRYVYTVQQTQSAFGVNSLVTQKQSVTVLAEAEGTVSVAEDLSYMQIAYMEDREIGENTTVMEYVN